MPRLVVLAISLLVSCAAPQPSGQHAASPVASRSAAKPSGVRARLPGYSASAVFPSQPSAVTRADGAAFVVQLQAGGPQTYILSAVSTQGRDRSEDAHWFEAMRERTKLKKERDVHLNSFRGVALNGSFEERATRVRLFAMGDTLFMLEVNSKTRALDEAAAERFLGSFELEPAWRIYASATTKFSVMVPAHAVEIDQTEHDDESRTTTRAFFLGGEDELIYFVSARELRQRREMGSEDEILDAAVANMGQDGTEVTWQAPVQFPQARGRDFLSSKQGATYMGRIVLTEHFVYMLMVGAGSRAGLQRADTAKFYASLVWY